jgi:hypothetical protein
MKVPLVRKCEPAEIKVGREGGRKGREGRGGEKAGGK